MAEDCKDILLRFYEHVAAPPQTRKNILDEARKAFGALFAAQAVEIYTDELLFFNGADGPPPGEAKTKTEAAVRPHGKNESKILACMAKSAGRPVCVFPNRKDGASIWGIPMTDSAGQLCGAVFCTTWEEPTEEALLASQRVAKSLAALCAFFRSEEKSALPKNEAEKASGSVQRGVEVTEFLSHELKTPLISMSYALQLLQKWAKEPEKCSGFDAEKYLKILERNVCKAQRLTVNLMDVCCTDLSARRPMIHAFEIVQFVEKFVEELQIYAESVQATLSFENRLGIDEYMITSDPFCVDRILLNLASNALQHTPAGGKATVILEKNGAGVYILVENEGDSIPQEAFAHLFEKFWRGPEKSSGAGLGLYLCKSFATVLGAEIRAENPAHGGARFILSLPAACFEKGRSKQVFASVPAAYIGSREELMRVELSALLP